MKQKIADGTAGAWSRIVLAGALMLLIGGDPASAQDPPGLQFLGGLAYEAGGPGPSLVDEMVAAGYDDPKPRSCEFPGCEVDELPFYFDEGLNVVALVGVRYRFEAPFSVEALFSNGQRGHAEAYSSELRDHLVVTYSSLLVATTVGAHVGPLRLSAGPVFNTTGWKVTRDSSLRGTGRTGNLGVMGGVSGSVRVSDLVLALKAGVRRFPAKDLSGAVQVAFEPDYRSFFIGLTAMPSGD